MFCYRCGAEVLEEDIFCTECGTNLRARNDAPNNFETKKAEQTVAPSGSNDAGEEEEDIIKQGKCNWIINPLLIQNGSAVLTNKRFVFKRGVLNFLETKVAAKILGKGAGLEILLDDIIGLRQGKQGVTKTVVIRTRDSKEHVCMFYGEWQEWLNILSQLTGIAV